MFSFNHEQGACPGCKGLGTVTVADPERLITDPGRSLLAGAMDGTKTGRFYGDPHGQFVAALKAAGDAAGMDFSKPYADLSGAERDLAWHGTGDRVYDIVWSYERGRRAGDFRFRGPWKGLAALVAEEYGRKHADRRGEAMRVLMKDDPCPGCGGRRLKPASLAVTYRGLDIAGLSALTVARSLDLLRVGRRRRAARRPRRGRDGGRSRRDHCADSASSGTSAWAISASTGPRRRSPEGEAQRLRLAGLLGVRLTGVTFVLDEPTLGLHPRDTGKLLDLIRGLTAEGNTVVAVEHDLDVVRAADHVIDLGPGAGAARRTDRRRRYAGRDRTVARLGDRTLSRPPRRPARAAPRGAGPRTEDRRRQGQQPPRRSTSPFRPAS